MYIYIYIYIHTHIYIHIHIYIYITRAHLVRPFLYFLTNRRFTQKKTSPPKHQRVAIDYRIVPGSFPNPVVPVGVCYTAVDAAAEA